jgi:hypothetical protein
MPKLKRKFTMLVASGAIGLSALAAPIALAGDYCPEPPAKKKCNAGRGNGSEGCDPGNSSTSDTGNAGQNQGGDEGGPIQGGTGAP